MLPQTNDPNTAPLNTAKKNKPIFILIFTLIVLFIVIGVFGIMFFKQKYLPSKPQAVSITNTISSPVNLKNPGIKSYGLFYFYEGNIEKIDDTSDGLKVTLDIPQEDIPEFIVAKPGTKVMLFNGNTYRTASRDALKAGQKVVIAVSYYSNLNRWLTQSVAIRVSELSPGESIEP